MVKVWCWVFGYCGWLGVVSCCRFCRMWFGFLVWCCFWVVWGVGEVVWVVVWGVVWGLVLVLGLVLGVVWELVWV